MLSSNVGKTGRGGLAIYPLVVDLNLALIQIDISNTSSEGNETSLIVYGNGIAGTDSNHTRRGLVYTDFYLTPVGMYAEHAFYNKIASDSKVISYIYVLEVSHVFGDVRFSAAFLVLTEDNTGQLDFIHNLDICSCNLGHHDLCVFASDADNIGQFRAADRSKLGVGTCGCIHGDSGVIVAMMQIECIGAKLRRIHNMAIRLSDFIAQDECLGSSGAVEVASELHIGVGFGFFDVVFRSDSCEAGAVRHSATIFGHIVPLVVDLDCVVCSIDDHGLAKRNGAVHSIYENGAHSDIDSTEISTTVTDGHGAVLTTDVNAIKAELYIACFGVSVEYNL